MVPCYNEEAAISNVVRAFAAQPGVVEVLVVDNASTDRTAELARAAGARVISESRPGRALLSLPAFARFRTSTTWSWWMATTRIRRSFCPSS